jgi:hypothetical protein
MVPKQHSRHDAAGVAALPVQRQKHTREIGAGRDGKGEAHEHRGVLTLRRDADADRDRADDESSRRVPP